MKYLRDMGFILAVSVVFAGLTAGVNQALSHRIALNQETRNTKFLLEVFDIPFDGRANAAQLKKIETGRIASADIDGQRVYRLYGESGKPAGYAFHIGGKGFWGNISGGSCRPLKVPESRSLLPASSRWPSSVSAGWSRSIDFSDILTDMWNTLSAFALPVLTVAGLTTTLAALILVAERYLSDYGEADLLINHEKKLRVRAGNTLLSTLKQHKIFVPSACGGRATCAYCKVKVNSGFGEPLPTETPLLSAQEMAQGVRLSCQIKVKTDVSITIPDALFKIKEYRAKLERVVDLTYDIKWFRFRLIEPDSIEYLAGQYIQFQAPEYGEVSESVYRAYSMCGRASEKGSVELMVRLVPGGIATTYLFHHLVEGGEATLTGPYGEFYLRDNPGRMLCVAGGSGMAPIRSIPLEMPREEIARRRPLFFFGARAVRDLFMLDEWREFETDNPGFQFIPALSQPDPDDRWEGLTGRITDVIANHVPDASNWDAYLCGGPGMLNACVAVLKSLGMSKDRIYYDKFE